LPEPALTAPPAEDFSEVLEPAVVLLLLDVID